MGTWGHLQPHQPLMAEPRKVSGQWKGLCKGRGVRAPPSPASAPCVPEARQPVGWALKPAQSLSASLAFPPSWLEARSEAAPQAGPASPAGHRCVPTATS